jgi:hypothetical protein
MPFDERWLAGVLAKGQVRVVDGTPPVGPPAISEAAFQAAVIKVAKACGWAVMHVHDSRRSPAGFPDLFCVRGDRALAWELKSADGIVTLQQAHWLRLLGQVTRVEADVWRPEDWSSIVERLRG